MNGSWPLCTFFYSYPQFVPCYSHVVLTYFHFIPAKEILSANSHQLLQQLFEENGIVGVTIKFNFLLGSIKYFLNVNLISHVNHRRAIYVLLVFYFDKQWEKNLIFKF